MKAELIDYRDQWELVNLAAKTTMWRMDGKYPSSEWKQKIIRAEHSPIRVMKFYVMVTDVPYYSIMHLVRHHVGLQPFVSSQRPDRSPTGTSRHDLPQDAPVSALFEINAQALIDISRVRLCSQADSTTQDLWYLILQVIQEHEPELVAACVRKCVQCGFCPEMKTCGYAGTSMYRTDRLAYIGGMPNA